jgi:hypothetical protein
MFRFVTGLSLVTGALGWWDSGCNVLFPHRVDRRKCCMSSWGSAKCSGFLGGWIDYDNCPNLGCAYGCSRSNGGTDSCYCKSGYNLRSGRYCDDINECNSRTECNSNAKCINKVGRSSYSKGYDCGCNPGYTGSGWGSSGCKDVNECTDSAHPHGCHAKATCRNTVGGNTCTCIAGYRGNGNSCSNINECAERSHNCHANADCTDNAGGFSCKCSTGYYDTGNGDGRQCADVDECALDESPCDENATCTNTIGSYFCECNDAHQGEGHECTHCSAQSSWTEQGDNDKAVCTCNAGYEGDGNVCQDIDECEVGTFVCDPNASCGNTIGSYTCTCNEGFYGFGKECSACDDSTDFTDMEISCDTSGIEVTIPYCAFWNVEITSQRFKGSGENCTIENTGVNMEMSLPATSECGTEVTNNGTYLVYSNAILGQVRDHNDPITRKKFLELEFSCGFEADQEISMDDSLHAMIDHVDVDFGRQDETFDIYMGVFTDEKFNDIVPEDYTITVPEKIYAGVELRNGEDALVLKMQRCWATPSSDPEDADGYVFIDDFCSTQSEFEGILNVLENGVGKQTKFELESFEFLGHLEGTLYLHCHANVCNSELGDCDIDCTKDTNNTRRRRRSTGELSQPAALRVGPIRVIPAQ